MKGSRVAALLVGAMAALTLSACGVPPSDVIQAGEPANGMLEPDQGGVPLTVVPLYFLHNGGLRPYPRKVRGPGDVKAVMDLLFRGPTRSEAATATTELPRLTDAPSVAIGKGTTFAVQLHGDAAPLSHLAMLQVACTVAHTDWPHATRSLDATVGGAPAGPKMPRSPGSPARTSVRVLGQGWSMTQSAVSCPDPNWP